MRKTRRVVLICLLAVLSAGLSGCGYKFVGQGGAFPQNVQRIYVEMFQNNTTQTGLENTITNAIVFEFTRRNKAGLASSLEQADAVLNGVVTGKTVQTVAPRGKDAAAQRRVTLSMNLKLIRVGGEIIWAGSSIRDNEDYPVAEDKLTTEQNEREAIVILATRLAEGIYNQLTDDF